MLIKKILGLLVISLLFLSTVFLWQMIAFEKQRVKITSYPRLICLIVAHFISMGYVVILYQIQQMFYGFIWGFLFSLNISLFITITQLVIYGHRQQYLRLMDGTKFSQPIQVIYINFYFLLYMFSLIFSFVLGIVCITLCCIEMAKRRKIRQSLQRNVTQIEYSEQLKQQQCPICLSAFHQNETLSKIRCNHIFHSSCLKQWIKVNTTCPNCRFNLFVDVNPEDAAEARQNL